MSTNYDEYYLDSDELENVLAAAVFILMDRPEDKDLKQSITNIARIGHFDFITSMLAEVNREETI